MSTQRVWQIACGSEGRRYEHIFLEFDVMLLGPGRFGPYTPETYKRGGAASGRKRSELSMLRLLAHKLQPGDVVVARTGKEVVAAGLVVGDYEHLEQFDDVHGWDLQHARRVAWQPGLERELRVLQRRATLFSERKQIPRLTRVRDRAVLEPLQNVFRRLRARRLKALPPPHASPPMSPQDVAEALFRKGLGYDAALQVERAIRKLTGLLAWYSKAQSPGRPSEHEVVAHIIMPLMLALGWSEQLLAVEWSRVDLAVFTATPTVPDNCGLVCEAKAEGSGLEKVLGQAEAYCKRLQLRNCSTIMVADGGRFYLYRRRGTEWRECGYVNLRRIRREHWLPRNADAIDTLMQLTPAWLSR